MILNIVTRLATAKNFYIITWEWYHITHKMPIILYHHLWHNFNYLLNMIQHNNSNSIAHSSYCIFGKFCYTIWMNLHSQLNERCNQSKIIWIWKIIILFAIFLNLYLPLPYQKKLTRVPNRTVSVHQNDFFLGNQSVFARNQQNKLSYFYIVKK